MKFRNTTAHRRFAINSKSDTADTRPIGAELLNFDSLILERRGFLILERRGFLILERRGFL